ncbi:MAG: tetratricopeptide repeat protein [Gemmataceae bacterium]|nr:tetratricopeptide repeat protein [Gemmataceae bacterium]
MVPALALTLAVLLGQTDNAPVAMVLAARDATFKRAAGTPKKAGPGELLYPKDGLAVAKAGSLTVVFFADEHLERIKPGMKATVERGGCTPPGAVERLKPAGAGVARSLKGLKTFARSGRAAGVVFRSPDLPDKAPAVTPMYGALILTDQPKLSWRTKEAAPAYRVQVLAANQRVVWSRDTREPTLTYPQGEKPLRRGTKYEWVVTALLGPGKDKELIRSKFVVATAGEMKEFDALEPLRGSKNPADLLLAAAVFQARGAYEESLSLYERLTKQAPEEPLYLAALADHYDRAGRLEEAARFLERALKRGYQRLQ